MKLVPVLAALLAAPAIAIAQPAAPAPPGPPASPREAFLEQRVLEELAADGLVLARLGVALALTPDGDALGIPRRLVALEGGMTSSDFWSAGVAAYPIPAIAIEGWIGPTALWATRGFAVAYTHPVHRWRQRSTTLRGGVAGVAELRVGGGLGLKTFSATRSTRSPGSRRSSSSRRTSAGRWCSTPASAGSIPTTRARPPSCTRSSASAWAWSSAGDAAAGESRRPPLPWFSSAAGGR